MPPKDRDAAWSTTAEYPNRGRPALRAAFEVGAVVVRKIVKDWENVASDIPSPSTP